MPYINDLVIYQASNVVVMDVNVLGSRMMDMIFRDIDCTEFVIIES